MRIVLRRVAIVLAVVVVLLIALALILPRVIDADRFRPEARATLEGLLGREVELGPLHLEVGFGVRVATSSLVIGPPLDPDAPPGPVADAGDVRLNIAIWPLLGGRVDLRGIAFSGGRVAQDGRPLLSRLDLDARIEPADGGATRWTGTIAGVADVLGRAPVEGRFDATLSSGVVELRRIDAEVGEGTVEGSGRIDGLAEGTPRVDLALSGSFGASDARGTVRADLRERRTDVDFTIEAILLDLDEIAAKIAGAPDGTEARAAFGLMPVARAAEPVGAAQLPAIVADGVVRAARGRFAGLEFTELESAFVYRDGEARFEDARFRLYGGRQAGRLGIRLDDPGMPFELDSDLTGVDLGALVAASRPDLAEAVEGTGSLTFAITGRAGDDGPEGTVRGSAAIEIADGRLSGVPLLDQIAAALAAASGRQASTAFDRLSGTFEIRDRRARTRDLALRSADLDLDGRGTVAFDGDLDLEVEARLSTEATAGILTDVPDLEFRVGDDGRLSVPMHVGGDLLAPEVAIDLRRVLEEGLGRKLRDKLKGLFGR